MIARSLYYATAFSTPIKIKFVARSMVLYILRRTLPALLSGNNSRARNISPVKYEATKCVRRQVAETRENRELDDIQASGRMSELGVCVISPAIVLLFVHRRLSPTLSFTVRFTESSGELHPRTTTLERIYLRSFGNSFLRFACDKNSDRTTFVELK